MNTIMITTMVVTITTTAKRAVAWGDGTPRTSVDFWLKFDHHAPLVPDRDSAIMVERGGRQLAPAPRVRGH